MNPRVVGARRTFRLTAAPQCLSFHSGWTLLKKELFFAVDSVRLGAYAATRLPLPAS